MTRPHTGAGDDDAVPARSARQRITTSADEPALIVAARHGDRDALDRLLRLHQPRLHALCRRLCRDQADALDALQEALIAIVRGLPRFDGRSSFGTWAYRVATNACLDELRRGNRRPALLDSQEADAVASRDDRPEAVGDRVDIDGALATLTPEFRAPVVLRDLCGFDYAEIGAMLQIPPGTVRSRISRGRAALAVALAPTGTAGNRTTPDERQTDIP